MSRVCCGVLCVAVLAIDSRVNSWGRAYSSTLTEGVWVSVVGQGAYCGALCNLLPATPFNHPPCTPGEGSRISTAGNSGDAPHRARLVALYELFCNPKAPRLTCLPSVWFNSSDLETRPEIGRMGEDTGTPCERRVLFCLLYTIRVWPITFETSEGDSDKLNRSHTFLCLRLSARPFPSPVFVIFAMSIVYHDLCYTSALCCVTYDCTVSTINS